MNGCVNAWHYIENPQTPLQWIDFCWLLHLFTTLFILIMRMFGIEKINGQVNKNGQFTVIYCFKVTLQCECIIYLLIKSCCSVEFVTWLIVCYCTEQTCRLLEFIIFMNQNRSPTKKKRSFKWFNANKAEFLFRHSNILSWFLRSWHCFQWKYILSLPCYEILSAGPVLKYNSSMPNVMNHIEQKEL